MRGFGWSKDGFVRRAASAVCLLAAAVTSAALPVSPAAAAPKANPVSETYPVLRLGDRGPDVLRVQKLLGLVGTKGIFGATTLATLKRFQKKAKIPVTGIVDAATWKALLAKKSGGGGSTGGGSDSDGNGGGSNGGGSATNGQYCPAPGARFGVGWGVPRGSRIHRGVDLMGPRGLPLLAVEDGYVVRAGRQSNGALRIVFQGTETGAKYYYGHNDVNLVSAGQRVKAGARIALMGDTGSRGSVHLHFEWWKSGGESASVRAEPLIKRLCGIGPG